MKSLSDPVSRTKTIKSGIENYNPQITIITEGWRSIDVYYNDAKTDVTRNIYYVVIMYEYKSSSIYYLNSHLFYYDDDEKERHFDQKQYEEYQNDKIEFLRKKLYNIKTPNSRGYWKALHKDEVDIIRSIA